MPTADRQNHHHQEKRRKTTTNLAFPIFEPHRAYRASWLWLPKEKVACQTLKSSLTFPLDERESIRLWREFPNHIGVPRALLPKEEVNSRFDLVDLVPKFDTVDLHSNITLDAVNPDHARQKPAFDALVTAGCGGVINLACGAGKTVLMLHLAAYWSQPTLIICEQTALLEQWKAEIGEFLQFRGRVGRIQGPPNTWDWEQPIVLGSLRSMVKHKNAITVPMRRRFGVVAWDEVHHMGAPGYSQTAALFLGRRYGITATVDRADGHEDIYLWHIGPVLYSDLTQDLLPSVSVINSPIAVNERRPDVRSEFVDRTGKVHAARFVNYVGSLEEELDFIERHLHDALRAGRKILAISQSVQQLKQLHERFPESGLIIGEVKDAQTRLDALANCQLCLGTTKLVREALNNQRLDTLFILNEFEQDGHIQQATGRIQRLLEGKYHPRIVLVRHRNIRRLDKRAATMLKYFRNAGFKL